MKKSTIAAFAAASLIGFGAVGSANAGADVAGFADISYIASSSDTEDGNFTASGEIDVMAGGDGMPSVRIDLDLINAHNGSAGADLPSGTDPGVGAGVGVDVEQLNLVLPLHDMVTLTAGIFNTPFGLEGQDAPDIHFAENGLLWSNVPSNHAGGLFTIMPSEQLTVNLGFINRWRDIAGLDPSNDWVATVTFDTGAGITGTVGYLTDNGVDENNMIDLNATAEVAGIGIELEYLIGDPTTGMTNVFDSGFGIGLSYHVMEGLLAAVRYESAEDDVVGTDETTETSIAVTYDLAENAKVRLDHTNEVHDTGTEDSSDVTTIQFLATF